MRGKSKKIRRKPEEEEEKEKVTEREGDSERKTNV